MYFKFYKKFKKGNYLKFYEIYVFFLSLTSLSSQFYFETNCDDCSEEAKNEIYTSSLWLSQSNFSSPLNINRFSMNFGFSIIEKNNLIPNFYNFLKITKNLVLTSKIYSFNINKTSPQILGAGLQYYFGFNDTLNWITSLQKVDIKGLKHYRLSTVTLSISKKKNFNNFEIFYGLGSNFYKEKSYINFKNIPKRIEGQINYLDICILSRFKFFNISLNLISSLDYKIISLIIQKDFF
tara:strand:+ start:775 stop:1485 length:711 start_codon:yes stop_codon:yes gene_type:complete